MMSIDASCTNARARSISCRSPPLIFMQPRLESFSIPSARSICMAFSRCAWPGCSKTPSCAVMPMRTLSKTVWSNAGECDCGIYAIFFASSRREYAPSSLPSTRISPPTGFKKPRRHRKSVLFPTPFGPSTAKSSPFSAVKDTSPMTGRAPYRNRRFFTSMLTLRPS